MESGMESIWQMVTQWGAYFSLSWLLTWRMTLSSNVHDKLTVVDSELKFSHLYSSLMSSLFSLAMAQFKVRMVRHEYRTNTKQKITYFICALLNTAANFMLLVNWQTAVTDLGVIQNMLHNYVASIMDKVTRSLIVLILLLTPHLYTFLVLPSSRLNIDLPCYSSPEFLHYFKLQCFIMSFYTFITATVNCLNWFIIGPLATPKLAEIARTISNGTIAMTNGSLITPSNAYSSSPFNARQGLLWISMLGIPLCWLFSYLGLYFYFDSSECKMRFREQEQETKNELDDEFEADQREVSTEKIDGNVKCSFSSLYKRIFLFKANAQGWWEDINDSSETDETKSIEEFFSSGRNEKEIAILKNIKESFSHRRKCKEPPLEFPFIGTDSFRNITRKEKLLKCVKYFLILLGLLISVAVIGIVIGLSRKF
eukprot:GFUD01012221.1.p1 GENE.GFUD01012221.1~~GFUD01012221.1.p1  ORF type:complete len:447 (+),score=70.17 GFUD01012221.1:67-1341(+)